MEGRTRLLNRGGKVEAGGLSRIAKEASQTCEYRVARNAPLRLRSEFVTFSKLPNIDAANKTVTTTKSSKIQKTPRHSRSRLAGAPGGLPPAEIFSEKIPLVPGWRGVLLSHIIADQEVDSRCLRRRVVVEILIHVVERSVILRHHPFFLQFQSIYSWIDALYPILD